MHKIVSLGYKYNYCTLRNAPSVLVKHLVYMHDISLQTVNFKKLPAAVNNYSLICPVKIKFTF